MKSKTRPAADDALARRAHDLENLRQAASDAAVSGDPREVTGESPVGQHPADVADFTYQRELQMTTKELISRGSAQVDEALRARASGTYGTCQKCRKQIPADRLAARPEATLCVVCQRSREGARAG